MEPLHQNILACLSTLVYIKVILAVCDYALARGWLQMDLSRKMVHVAAGSWSLFWPYFDESHWSWQLNVAIPAVYSVQLFAKGALFPNPNDPDVKSMSRTGKPIELCYGPLFFTLVMLYCGLYQFKTNVGVYMMGALGFGDGLAPLVGKRFPYGRYPTLGSDNKSLGRPCYKTVSGSLTMFLATILGIVCLRWGIGAPQILDWPEILRVATAATVAEAATGKWDNPCIALAVWAAVKQGR